jgi:hypothetical protein
MGAGQDRFLDDCAQPIEIIAFLGICRCQVLVVDRQKARKPAILLHFWLDFFWLLTVHKNPLQFQALAGIFDLKSPKASPACTSTC